MGMRFSQLQCKEVICMCNGERLGFVSDIVAEVPEGNIAAIVVPGPCRILGMAGRRDDYVIPWSCVKKVGPDIVLVDIHPKECRVPRPKKKLL